MFFKQYQFNVGKGPLYENESALPSEDAHDHPVKFIAYYLPQFHTVAENDTWWGPGFTEWTNVTKALPRYIGHRQPNLPADLGFYDLSHANTLRRQADLARRGGIYGFCIHNYWFSGRQILEKPLNILLDNPDIDIRFCINWANESWSRRWDGSDHDILLHQGYDTGDEVGYAKSILPALRDPRYIRINGRPLIMLYRPGVIPDARRWIERLRDAIRAEGVGDPYLVMAHAHDDTSPLPYGLDAAAGFPPHNGGWNLKNERSAVRLLDPDFDGTIASYEVLMRRMLQNRTEDYRLFPGVCTGWDNEARRPGRGASFYGSTPAVYGEWLRTAAEHTGAWPSDERLVFINAWNEWAEGAYLEPDRHTGYAYLAETRRVLAGLGDTRARVPAPAIEGMAARLWRPRPSPRHRPINGLRRLKQRFLRLSRAR